MLYVISSIDESNNSYRYTVGRFRSDSSYNDDECTVSIEADYDNDHSDNCKCMHCIYLTLDMRKHKILLTPIIINVAMLIIIIIIVIIRISVNNCVLRQLRVVSGSRSLFFCHLSSCLYCLSITILFLSLLGALTGSIATPMGSSSCGCSYGWWYS